MADDIKNKKATKKEQEKKTKEQDKKTPEKKGFIKSLQKRKIKVEKNGKTKAEITKTEADEENKDNIKKIKIEKMKADISKNDNKKKVKEYYDYSFIFAILFLLVFGLIMIFSASSYTAELKFKSSAFFVKKQLGYVVFGCMLMMVVSRIPYTLWIKLSKFIYAVTTFLALLVLIIGKDVNGAKRWLKIGPINFQPSETVKVAIIIFLAYYLVKYKDELHSDDRKVVEKKLWILFAIVSVPTLLVMKENLSTAIIIFLIAFCMSFMGTVNKRLHLAGALAMGVALFTAKPLVKFIYDRGIRDYHLTRFLVWAEPEKFSRDGGYQVMQGLYAIGSGKILGKGLGLGMQKFFLPESQNDMIFAIIVEEMGLFGAGLVMAIFAFMIYRMLIITFSVKEPEGVYLVVGVLIHLSLQVILNIAVVTGVLPNTGVSLPFISFGGSSILILLAEMGIVLSVARTIKME